MRSVSNLVNVDDIKTAWRTIKHNVHRTPQNHSSYFSDSLGTNIYFKEELFQKTGSFKVRGVSNKMSSLSDEEKRNGVITLSAGNHAQAVAWAATQYGIPSTIVMPANSVAGKQRATHGYGGEVVLTEGSLLDTCLQLQKDRNLYLIHPFDDPLIIAGHGTVGLEIVEDLPDVDVVVVGVGGGGLISGVAAAVKQLRPKTTVIGVEPDGALTMTRSLAQGSPATLSSVNTIADGLSAPFVGKHNLRHTQAFVDEIVVVTDDEIRSALRLIWERTKLLAEPAAATTLAALMTEKVSVDKDAKVVCIMCGGNVDLDNLAVLGFG